MKIIIIIIMTVFSQLSFSEQTLNNSIEYNIGFELGFQSGANRVFDCVKSNDIKEKIEVCIQSLIAETNKEKSVFPESERLELK